MTSRLRERINQADASSLGANHAIDGEPATVTRQLAPAAQGTVVARRAPQEVDPRETDQDFQWARRMAKSGMLPKSFQENPENIVWAVGYARALGVPVMTALHGIYVIKGNPAMTAQMMAGLVRRAGHRLYVRTSGEGLTLKANATLLRKEDAEDPPPIPDFDPTFRVEWDLRRARDAGLVQVVNNRLLARSSKGEVLPWEAFPRAMLKARAISEVLREACQDVLMGVAYTPEELGANVTEDEIPLDVDGSQIQGGIVDPTVSPVAFDAKEGEVADFNPAEADHAQWRQVAADFAESGNVDGLRRLWHLAATHRPDDDALAEFFRALNVASEAA